jgi:malonate transporter and related proteins
MTQRNAPDGTQMLQILVIISPIFVLIALGFIAVRLNVVLKEQLPSMGTFLLYFAMPALIVRVLVSRPIADVVDIRYLLAYGAGSIFVFCLGLCLTYFSGRKDLPTSSISALGMAASNSGFVGYPIVDLVLGPPAGLALALCMMVENIVIIPAALAIAEAGSQPGLPLPTVLRSTALRLIKNPIMIAILVGVAISVSGVRLPPPLLKAVDMLAAASAPVALFVIGGTLVGLKVAGLGHQVAPIAAGKLLVHPVAVGTALIMCGNVGPDLKWAAVIFASVPMLSIYPILGQRYGIDDVCAAALLVSTMISVFTISAVIWLLQMGAVPGIAK